MKDEAETNPARALAMRRWSRATAADRAEQVRVMNEGRIKKRAETKAALARLAELDAGRAARPTRRAP